MTYFCTYTFHLFTGHLSFLLLTCLTIPFQTLHALRLLSSVLYLHSLVLSGPAHSSVISWDYVTCVCCTVATQEEVSGGLKLSISFRKLELVERTNTSSLNSRTPPLDLSTTMSHIRYLIFNSSDIQLCLLIPHYLSIRHQI